MNSVNSSLRIVTRSFGLIALLATIAGSAYAGPGIQYWRPAAKPAEHTTAQKQSVACTGQETVAVKEFRQTWPNGRGTPAVVQTGTKQVCHTCAGTAEVMTRAWPNGKGPLVLKTIPAAHDCGDCATPGA